MLETELDTVQTEPEAESPVCLPEQEAPTAFAAANLRAELVAAELASHPEPLPETQLPATLPEALAKLREITTSVPADKVGQKLKDSASERLREHVHKLSQAPTPPRIDYGAFRKSLNTPPAAALAFIEASYPKTKSRKV